MQVVHGGRDVDRPPALQPPQEVRSDMTWHRHRCQDCRCVVQVGSSTKACRWPHSALQFGHMSLVIMHAPNNSQVSASTCSSACKHVVCKPPCKRGRRSQAAPERVARLVHRCTARHLPQHHHLQVAALQRLHHTVHAEFQQNADAMFGCAAQFRLRALYTDNPTSGKRHAWLATTKFHRITANQAVRPAAGWDV